MIYFLVLLSLIEPIGMSLQPKLQKFYRLAIWSSWLLSSILALALQYLIAEEILMVWVLLVTPGILFGLYYLGTRD